MKLSTALVVFCFSFSAFSLVPHTHDEKISADLPSKEETWVFIHNQFRAHAYENDFESEGRKWRFEKFEGVDSPCFAVVKYLRWGKLYPDYPNYSRLDTILDFTSLDISSGDTSIQLDTTYVIGYIDIISKEPIFYADQYSGMDGEIWEGSGNGEHKRYILESVSFKFPKQQREKIMKAFKHLEGLCRSPF